MGRGSSKAGGAVTAASVVTPSRAELNEFIDDLANQLANPPAYDSGQYPLSNGDLQDIVEQYAMGKNVDEDEILEAIRNKAEQIESKAKASGNVATTATEQRIYDMGSTPAFPSTASVVKRVPQLKELDNALKSAPEGTRVAFDMGDIVGQVWVYEKANSRNWNISIIDKDKGTVRKNGSLGGIKLLQSLSDKKFRALRKGLTQSQADLLGK